jgi:hypothetical protein
MGREAEHHSTDPEQESAVPTAAMASSKQQPKAAGADKQQQHKAASIADACHSHPMQPAAHSPATTRSSKKSRTEQLAGAR